MLWSENKLALFTLNHRFRYDHILRMAMDSLSIQVPGLTKNLFAKNISDLVKAILMPRNDDESLISKLKSNCWDLVESRTLSKFQNSNPLSAEYWICLPPKLVNETICKEMEGISCTCFLPRWWPGMWRPCSQGRTPTWRPCSATTRASPTFWCSPCRRSSPSLRTLWQVAW